MKKNKTKQTKYKAQQQLHLLYDKFYIILEMILESLKDFGYLVIIDTIYLIISFNDTSTKLYAEF